MTIVKQAKLPHFCVHQWIIKKNIWSKLVLAFMQSKTKQNKDYFENYVFLAATLKCFETVGVNWSKNDLSNLAKTEK